MYQNDQEILDQIKVIVNGQETDQEKLDQLIELNKEQNEWLSKIVEMQAKQQQALIRKFLTK